MAAAAALGRIAARGALVGCRGRAKTAGSHSLYLPLRSAGSTSSTTRKPVMWYQSHKVPTSTLATGKVGTRRDLLGSDGEFFGVDPVAIEVDIHDGRQRDLTLDRHGVELLQHTGVVNDYYDNNSVLKQYYPECEALVCEATGASSAVAFDHNLRAKSKKDAEMHLDRGNAVQEPLITYGVHNDYTAASAPRRLEQLAKPPKQNDTLKPVLGDRPAVDPEAVPDLLRRRWIIINVWRNVSTTPIHRFPLAMMESSSMSTDDLVVFEIHYEDRIGENYFARHSDRHMWSYFPQMTRDEVILLKTWDSHGADFAEAAAEKEGLVPSTFALHSAFEDPATPEGAPDRESIEVRVMAFFDS